MLVTDFSRRVKAYRSMSRDLLAKGWEEIDEGGGKLWELASGYRYNHEIVEVKIAPGGKSLFVKIEKR